MTATTFNVNAKNELTTVGTQGHLEAADGIGGLLAGSDTYTSSVFTRHVLVERWW